MSSASVLATRLPRIGRGHSLALSLEGHSPLSS